MTTSGSVPATGRVNFTWGAYSIGAAQLDASGVATLTRSTVNADPFGAPYPLVAVYLGRQHQFAATRSGFPSPLTSTSVAPEYCRPPNL